MKSEKSVIRVNTEHSEYIFMVDDQNKISPEDRERLLTKAQAFIASFEKAEQEPQE